MTPSRTAVGERSWWRYLVPAEAAVVGAVVAPGVTGVALGAGVAVSAIVAVLRGRRRWARRHGLPWTLLAIAFASFLGGHLVRVVHRASTGGDAIPSPADLLYLAGYTLVAVAIVDLLRRRSPRANAPVIAETLVIAVAAVVLSWTHLLAPSLDESHDGWELAVLWLRPLADVVLASLAARLASGGGLHAPAWRLGGLALLGLVIGDTTWALANLGLAQCPAS